MPFPEEQMQGALTQTNSPAEPMADTAAGGVTGVGDMFKSLLANSQAKQDYLAQQQAAYNADMQKYAQMVEQSQQPDYNAAARWGSMAQAASEVAPTWGNMGAMIGQVGGAYGASRGLENAAAIRNQGDLAKMRQTELRALEASNQNNALVKAMYGGNKGMNPTIKVVDGKLIKYDPTTDTTEVLSGSQDQVKSRMFSTFYKARVAQEDPNATENAQADVDRTLAQFGGTTVTGKSNNIPGVSSVSEQPSSAGADNSISVAPSLAEMLSPTDRDAAARLVTRINANPQAAKNDLATLQKLILKYDERVQKPPSNTLPSAAPMTYIDKPKRKMEEATGEVAGKALGEELGDLNNAASSSSQMIGQLDLLKRLYQTPNMPEGKFAAELQGVRSGLKSLGIDVGDEVSAADLASSIAGKMALLTRTAEGKNLMPGAMSDFEQKILRGLVPGLEGTAEGRAALIDVMQNMARSRMRFAEEANKLAESNRGILPSEWNTRKQRIMKEEMARLALLNQSVASRFQGAK